MLLNSVLPLMAAFCCIADASSFIRPALPAAPNGRIVGGESTTIEENPWQALIQIYGMAYCGASIVSKDWVVTAAHCTNYPVSATSIKVGSATKNTGGSIHSASAIIAHENFAINNNGIPKNDVAVIRVKTPFTLDATRQPIQLFGYEEEAFEGIESVITGWGAIREGGSSAEVLQAVRVPIVGKATCSEAYSDFGGIPKGQICAAHPQGGKDACQGDSGGPLTIGGRLAGIVSWGNGCARPGYPGVYTEIATYHMWINEKISTPSFN